MPAILNNVDILNITYGVEIECAVPSQALAANGWQVGGRRRGIQIPTMPQGWTAERDGSIHVPDYTYEQVEVVSPILSGPEGLAQVREVCRQLEEIGAVVNASTGVHVHVGFPQMDVKALRRLINVVAQNEQALYAVGGCPRREQSIYCEPLRQKHAAMEHARDEEIPHLALNVENARYCSLNLTNLLSQTKRAIEIRAFAGSVKAARVLLYVQVALGVVHKALQAQRCMPWNPRRDNRGSCVGLEGAGRAAVGRLLTLLAWRSGYRVERSLNGAQGFGLVDASSKDEIVAEALAAAAQYDA